MKKVTFVLFIVTLFGYGLSGLSPISNAGVHAQKPTPPQEKTDPPTKVPDPAPDKPAPKPTSPPRPTAQPTQPPPKPTVAPTKDVVVSTPTLAKATAVPTPRLEKPSAVPSPLPTRRTGESTPGATAGTPAPGTGMTVTATLATDDALAGGKDTHGDEEDVLKEDRQASIVVQVFDDRDGDGIQDPDERGVAGVPVLLDGAVVGATGTDGQLRLSFEGHIRGRARLSIVSPTGWRWAGAPLDTGEILSTGRAAIPVTKEVDSPAPQGLLPTVALLAALGFVGFASLAQAGTARSLLRTYRRQTAHSLEWRQYASIQQRRAEVEETLRDTGDWQGVLHQVLADALPEVAANADADTNVRGGNAWLAVADVGVSPGRFTVVRSGGEAGDKRYTFTTSPRRRPWRERAIPLDAALSPSVRVEVEAVWRHLAEKRRTDPAATVVLPRRAEWYLLVERNWLKLRKFKFTRRN